MRLATVVSDTQRRDGQLCVVSGDSRSLALVPASVASSLLDALSNWGQVAAKLATIATELDSGKFSNTLSLSTTKLLAPLPRTFAFFDGSAYISHIERARRARGAALPEDLLTVPLMYQGASDNLLGPNSPIEIQDPAFGYDFEAELAVVLSGVPQNPTLQQCSSSIALILLMNDLTLRNLVPRELGTGFGFIQSKPPSYFAPFAITPDHLGAAWNNGRASLAIECSLNGKPFGKLDSSEMHFSFPELIMHAARTRPLSPGTIIGAGTVSNADYKDGFACIVEKRCVEQTACGEISTGYLKAGDIIEIKALAGNNLAFGAIQQVCK